MPDLILYAIPAFIALLVLEALAYTRLDDHGYGRRDTAASISMGLGNVVINAGWKFGAFAIYTAAYELTPLRLGSGAVVWLLLIVGDDLAYYWFHRAHHEVRVLWASHVVHHSSERYNLSTALRQTWTPMTSFAFWLPLAFLGFQPWMILTMQSVSLLYQFWIHTELIDRLGPLEWVLNTPSHHRVHHGANQQYLDRNYAGIFIVWDRLFGTFVPEGEPVAYGLTKNIKTYHPVRIAFHEFAAIAGDVRRASTWRQRFGYVLRGPGWEPA